MHSRARSIKRIFLAYFDKNFNASNINLIAEVSTATTRKALKADHGFETRPFENSAKTDKIFKAQPIFCVP